MQAGAPPLRDRELVVDAIRKAGGQKPLAAIFGVSQSAISEWGRSRPIPRHVRPRLEGYLRNNEGVISDQKQQVESSPQDHAVLSPPVDRLLRLVDLASEAKTLADLPRPARKRFEDRANELITWLRRQLKEYQLLLEAEHKRKVRSRKKGRSHPNP